MEHKFKLGEFIQYRGEIYEIGSISMGLYYLREQSAKEYLGIKISDIDNIAFKLPQQEL